MYLRNLHIRNIGPIEKLDLEFELQENFNPKPIILVGKNGSGKTYTLSYIADSFYELAKKQFNDIVKKSNNGEFKHEVRQFQKPYDNQQAEQISLMV